MTTRQSAYRERLESTGARQRAYMLDADTLAAVERLRLAWGCTATEAVRRAIRQAG